MQVACDRAPLHAPSLRRPPLAPSARRGAGGIPVPALSLGFKTERIAGTSGQANGFVAGVSFLSVLGPREGASRVDADARRGGETKTAAPRLVGRRSIRRLSLSRAQLRCSERRSVRDAAAMRAVQVAYSEENHHREGDAVRLSE